jgi:hypothetical protein
MRSYIQDSMEFNTAGCCLIFLCCLLFLLVYLMVFAWSTLRLLWDWAWRRVERVGSEGPNSPLDDGSEDGDGDKDERDEGYDSYEVGDEVGDEDGPGDAGGN